MSTEDRTLRLAAKRSHLAQVIERCRQGQGLHINVPLRKILEGHVKEVGRGLIAKERGGPER